MLKNESAEMSMQPKSPIIVRDQSLLMREDGILHVVHLSPREHTIEDAIESMKHQLILQNGKKTPVLVDLRKAHKITRETHSNYARIRHVTAAALLTDSAVSEFLANTVIKIYKPDFPARMFRDEKAAIEWLLPFVDISR